MQNKNWSLAGALFVASAILTPHAAMAQTNQTIAFGALLPKEVGDPPFALSATATSALAVAFSTPTPAICSVSGTTAAVLAAGTCTITANQAGNGAYFAAPAVSQSFLVNPEDDGFSIATLVEAIRPACTGVVASPPSVQVQANFTLTATCSKSPTTYEWKLGTTVIATTTTATLGVVAPATAGTFTYSVRASKSNIWSSVVSAAVTVTALPVVLNVTAPATVTLGSAIVFSGTATGGSGALTVLLTNDGQQLGLATATNGSYSLSWTPTKAGVYTFKILASDKAAYTTVLVTEQPAAQPLAIPGTSNAGATAGSFNVSDSGAASYSIPISVPPGIAGMQPSLALSYNSQGGNGHLGAGWSLSGLSAITRCPKTIAQDGVKAGVNYDNDIDNDVFCLDGQRLIKVGVPISGSDAEYGAITIIQYRTEIDRFDRIESYQQDVPQVIQGPMNFKVYTKGGQIMQYGLRWWAKNSAFGQGTGGNTVKVWPLDRVADRYGNYYVIDYAGSEGVSSAPVRNPLFQSSAPAPAAPSLGAFPGTELYPVQITYTMNQFLETAVTQVNRVVLEYEDRPSTDRHVLFDAGAGQTLISKRLRSIKTYIDGTRQLFTTLQGVVLDYPYVVCGTGQGTTCGGLVKRYELNYGAQSATGRTLLNSVQEFAANGVALPATTFTWSAGQNDFLGAGSGAVTQVNGSGADLRAFAEFAVADVDGDGRSDLVRRYGESGTGHIHALLWRANGYEDRHIFDPTGEVAGPDGSSVTPMDLNGDGRADFVVFNPAPTSGKFKACITNSSATTLSCTLYQAIARPTSDIFYFGDFNGDGKIDLLIYRGPNVATLQYTWDLHLGIATGFNTVAAPVFTSFATTDGAGEYSPGAYSVGDFNGDGRADLISRKTPDSCPFPAIPGEPCFDTKDRVTWRVYFSTPGANNSTTFVAAATDVLATNANTEKNVTYDFNGDGLSDLVAPVNPGTRSGFAGIGTNTGTLNICLSAGDGSFGTYQLNAAIDSTSYVGNSLCKTVLLPPVWRDVQFKDIMFGDFNGDGRTDMMVQDNTTACPASPAGLCWNVCPSTLNATDSPPIGNVVSFSCSTWKTKITESINNTRIGDFNGDGKTDFVSSNASQVANVVSLAGGSIPDLLTRVTNGMAAYTTIEYAPLTDGTVYTKGTSATAEKIDIQSPMYVVKKTMSTNGLGGTFDTTYKYASLIAQTDGRGLLGFGKKTVEHFNGEATVRTVTSYFNDVWWRAGRVASVRKCVGGNVCDDVNSENNTVNLANNTYELKSLPSSNLVYQVHLTSTTERSWNLSGTTVQALPYTVTSTPLVSPVSPSAVIDEYGNVPYVKVATFDPVTNQADGYQKETTNTYFAADTVNWIIGRLQKASVKHTMIGGATTTRTSSFVYDATPGKPTGQLTVEKVEPDENEAASSVLWLTKTYTHDEYGNVKQVDATFADKTITGSLAVTTRTTRTKYCTDATRTASACVIDGRFPTRVEGALAGHVETRVYDRTFGNMTESVDPNGLKTVSTFDGFGRKVADTLYDSAGQALGHSTSTYTAVAVTAGTGYTVENRTHTGGYSRATFDTLGREISLASRTFSGGEATSTTAYDIYGRKAWVSGPRGGSGGINNYLTTTIGYDKLGRPISEIVRAGQNAPAGGQQTSTTTIHNVLAEGNRTYAIVAVTQSVTDTANHTVTNYTDSQGRTAKIVDNAGGITTYGYDPIGNLAQVSGPGTISETMVYDRRGRKQTATNANISGSYVYAYNGAGELLSQTDPKSQITRQQYDALGRMTERNEQGTTSTWAYDTCTKGIGKLCSTNMGTTTHEYAYDAQARPQQVKSTIDGQIFTRYTLYNPKGQMSYVGYPATEPGEQPLGLITTYNVNGFADKVQKPGAIDPYWTATSRYDDGSFYAGTNGAAPYEKDYDILGRLSAVRLKTAQSVLVNTSTYAYDKIGNLTSRNQQQAGGAVQDPERFCYDALNRVTHAAVNSAALGCTVGANFTYSADGNLLTKGGATGAVGTITYGTAARTNNAGPHAVANAESRDYFYDLNGNLEQIRSGTTIVRAIGYTPFNLPSAITGSNPLITGLSGNSTLSYFYDSAHARVKDIAQLSDGSIHTTLHASSGFFEKAMDPGGSIEYRHYMSGPDGTIGVHTVYASPVTQTYATRKFWLKDHLGSPVAEYQLGALASSPLTTMGFDAWGLRRKGFSAVALTTGDLAVLSSPRGFTGHEHLDEVGLVHMNGRIYDPLIGRFLQMDPIVQEPYNSQNFNRYSYVLNNPLAYTDPSGYSWWTEVRRPVGAIIATWLLGPGAYSFSGLFGSGLGIAGGLGIGGATLSSVMAGFAAGGIAGGNIESALTGAFTAGFLDAIGTANLPLPEKVLAHAIAGCIGAGANGDCGRGALAGGFAAAAGAALPKGWDNIATRALIGGAVSQASGGKFGNGAFTASFNYLLNDLSHAARAKLVGAGAFLGGTVGAVAAGGCTAGTGGVCALGAPAMIVGGAAGGAVFGNAIASAWDQLDNLVSKATEAGPQAVQYALVAERAGLYPTVRGEQVQLNAGDVWKYGISTDPAGRYPAQALSVLGVRMDIQAVGTLPQMYVAEKIQLINYAVSNGSLPPGNRIFK